ncbi:protein kinase family protein [Streptomyces sp. KR80]|uniref:protein kinase family protein n=1 Tax=Streptomyces sp. KR80 TaxID=3457426 RepID=UPI003FD0982A
MAERSTAAVDVADSSGDEPLTAQAEKATADGVDAQEGRGAEADAKGAGTARSKGEETSPAPEAEPPELHSGHKLARRYRLEECVTRLDGFSSWRAVDEKLRRAVGVHVLPADHPRARPVLSAARSAALLGDPRFVQVLDAVEENDLVYVVHEWLPDATELTNVLASGPLEPHEAYQLVSQVSQAMAAAHREGLAHLRLTPSSVLRTESGQYRIRGLAVMAALRGIRTDHPQRTDTEAIGALLYAALTQRWPYEENAYGLSGLPKGVGLIAPDQVRAGVHRGLSELAMRALVNEGATPSRQEPPCTTPEELSKAVTALPRIRPPEPSFATPTYRPTTYQQGGYHQPANRNGSGAPARPVPVPPPPLQTRTGQALKWTVAALLIAALGLGSWQLADTLMDRENRGDDSGSSQSGSGSPGENTAPESISIVAAQDFDPLGDGSENPDQVGRAYDGDKGSYWETRFYVGRPDLGGLKSGVGLILDLGKPQQVGTARISFIGSTTVQLMAAPEDASAMPTSLDGFSRVARGSGTHVKLEPPKPVTTRYVLVWLTELPPTAEGNYRGKVADIKITS